MQATYTKLKDGSWGLRVIGKAAAGDVVTVTKKSGETETKTVVKSLWFGKGKAGEDITLATIEASALRSSNSGSNGYGRGHRRACKTGGNCSSIGSGKSCGADDCDGY